MEEEIEYRVEIRVRVHGEELRVHVQDPAQGGALDAHGGEAALHGLEGGEGAGPEIRVLLEGFLGIDVQVTLQVDELFPEEDAGVGGVDGVFGGLWRWGERRLRREEQQITRSEYHGGVWTPLPVGTVPGKLKVLCSRTTRRFSVCCFNGHRRISDFGFLISHFSLD